MERSTWGTRTARPAVLVVLLAGCRSDLSQQLLERELRMQEDQIYQLQDELAEKCVRLDRVAGENSSLRRQLGVGDREPLPASRGGQRSAAPAAPLPAPRSGDPPVFVPPPIVAPSLPAPGGPPALPGAAPRGGPPAPGSIAPPALEGVPPLPAEPRFPGAAAPDRGPVIPVSAEEGIADSGRITHLVVNASRTACFDGDGDGTSEGLAIVFEPRDGDERLVTAAGDVAVAVFDAGADGQPVAAWEIPASEAAGHFRRTSRNRGLHFVLRWPGPPPRGRHVRVAVSLTTFDGTRFEADATVAATVAATPGADR